MKNKYLLIILCVLLGHYSKGQNLLEDEKLEIGDKKFIVDQRKNGFTVDNVRNVNLKDGYEWHVLLEGKFSRQKLSEILLDVFPEERILELQEITPNKNPGLSFTWHIDNDGKICSVTYLLQRSNHMELKELSELEDKIKAEILVTDFLSKNVEKRDYYTLTYHIRLSKVLDGSFVK